MREDVPFQMVMELLEGSVSEVMNAAHTTSSASVGSSYLTFYEQLSIALDVTSAIAYLHQTHPKPYVEIWCVFQGVFQTESIDEINQ